MRTLYLALALAGILALTAPARSQYLVTPAEELHAQRGIGLGTLVVNWSDAQKATAWQALEDAKSKPGFDEIQVGRAMRIQDELRGHTFPPIVLERTGAIALATSISVPGNLVFAGPKCPAGLKAVLDRALEFIGLKPPPEACGQTWPMPTELTLPEAITTGTVLSSAWCYWGRQPRLPPPDPAEVAMNDSGFLSDAQPLQIVSRPYRATDWPNVRRALIIKCDQRNKATQALFFDMKQAMGAK